MRANPNSPRMRAIAKLQRAGVDIEKTAPIAEVMVIVAVTTGIERKFRQRPDDYLSEYVTPRTAPREPRPWVDLPPHKHPRLAEIECLPRPVSMSGVGNGGDQGYGRGR
ncbi:MAG: hypothetical protein EPN62_00895 [Candidimonas sp.]|nr:MAG: hypothetical protein EPN77_01895 [Candidimonas sp.]TAM26885.1 MAG: hypothetical protein EPN62_00895 [Candidimonas sp.]